MTAFSTVSDLLQLLCDTIVAHEYATKRHILHRDISAGNILINRKGDVTHALLVDWDLALDMQRVPVSEQHYITGTWQFMSITLLQGHSMQDHPHGIPDDLESIFWLLCYCLLRYTNACPGSDEVTRIYTHDIFDDSRRGMGQDKTQASKREGGEKKWRLLTQLSRFKSKYLQPSNFADALVILIGIASKILLHHILVEDAQLAIDMATREGPPLTILASGQLESARDDLVNLKNAPPPNGGCLDYRSFKTAFVAAVASMRAYESSDAFSESDASKSPSAGSLRVKDRFKATKDTQNHERRDNAEQEDADRAEDANRAEDAETVEEEKRIEKKTSRGSVKRGSTRGDESPPKPPKLPRSGSRRSTRSGQDSASGSYRDSGPLLGTVTEQVTPRKSAAKK